jgi:hypothetical protein
MYYNPIDKTSSAAAHFTKAGQLKLWNQNELCLFVLHLSIIKLKKNSILLIKMVTFAKNNSRDLLRLRAIS